jgi:hypothetical protein
MRAIIAELKSILQQEHCQCMHVLSLIWTRVLTCFQVSPRSQADALIAYTVNHWRLVLGAHASQL